ncbi:MAG: ABC transporter permease subunit [Myxococcales bacterium]|nr:ABC transporter permease subunit [Myxococcales bacterium]
MMGRIYAIAINTFREAVRDKVLYGVIAFATVVLLFSLALAELSLNESLRVVLDTGLASISIFNVVVAIFLGSSLLYKEIERKTLYVILPKPIRRWEFLVGKFFGITLTGAVFVLAMGAVQLWVTSIQAGASMGLVVATPVALGVVLGLALWKARDRTAVLVPWSLVALGAMAVLCAQTEVEILPILYMLSLYLGELLVLAAVALLFSSFSTPFLTGVFTFGVWFVGRSADEMATMKSAAIPELVRGMLRGLSYVTPNFNLFVPGHYTLANPDLEFGSPALYVLSSMGYAVLYTAVILIFAAIIFRRRDFL